MLRVERSHAGSDHRVSPPSRVAVSFRTLQAVGRFQRGDNAGSRTVPGTSATNWRFSEPPVGTLVEAGGPAARAFSAAQPGRPVRFTVRRGGETLTLEIVPESGGSGRRTPPPDRPE